MEVSQGPERTVADRIDTWLALSERYASAQAGTMMYSGDWAALAATLRGAKEALSKLPSTST